jgi:hypothetical protein
VTSPNLLERLRGYVELSAKHTQEGRRALVEAYLVLYRLNKEEILWREHYRTWPELLHGEGFTKSTWRRFQLGFEAFDRKEEKVRKYGLQIIRNVGNSRSNKRAAIVRRLERGDPPSEVFKQTSRKGRTREVLIRYIGELRRALKKASVSVPRPPWKE